MLIWVLAKLYSGNSIIGIYKGPYLGIMEHQAKWSVALLHGDISYPDDAELERGLNEELAIRSAGTQFPHGDYVQFMEKLASNYHNSLSSIDFSRIPEEYKFLFEKGPITPAHYLFKTDPDRSIEILSILKDYLPDSGKDYFSFYSAVNSSSVLTDGEYDGRTKIQSELDSGKRFSEIDVAGAGSGSADDSSEAT